MEALAKYLRVDRAWLQLGVSNPSDQANVSYIGKHKDGKNFPLISWVSAGSWLEALEPYRKEEIDVWPETTVDASEGSFWLRVKGDSMTSPVGFTVPEGMIILVDPDKEAVSGKLVVAKLENENEATFKQFMVDAGRKYLKALNPHHPPTIVNGNCKIIGVVVDIKWEHIP
jgi:SOS-response transcriptional repressor LexA